MKLIVQPDAGVVPIMTAIKRAKKSIDVLIFRHDIPDIEGALSAAVGRGVVVRALIAYANRGGTKSLRKLEMHLLAAGVTVARTAEDLAKYHGKMMIVDGRSLHVYGFNFTWLDIERSRSFGAITRNRKLVQEAMKLFETDMTRKPYASSHDRLVVSPENSRKVLTAFLKAANKQLLIYDPKVSDPSIVRVLVERAKAGVDVRIIGKLGAAKSTLTAEKLPGNRLHVRAIVRDRSRAFIGSQSLRKVELDRRREVGLIFTDKKAIKQMADTFEADWAMTDSGKRAAKAAEKERDKTRGKDKDKDKDKDAQAEAVGASA